MHHFPSHSIPHDTNLGLFLNATIVNNRWQFQNNHDLLRNCVYPHSPLRQLFSPSNCSGIFKEYEYKKEELTKFLNFNPLLIPSSVIVEAMQPILPEHLFIDNLIEQIGECFLFPSGKIGASLYLLNGNGSTNEICEFFSPISQIHSISQDLISTRLCNSVHLLQRQNDRFLPVGSFDKIEPSKISSSSFPTNELAISSTNGTLSFFSFSTSRLSTIRFDNCEYFSAKFASNSNILLCCNNFRNLSLSDRRFKQRKYNCLFGPISNDSLIGHFEFLSENFVFASSTDCSIFYDIRMPNQPVLVDRNAGGSVFSKYLSSNSEECNYICYNSNSNQLGIHFYNLQNDSARIDSPPCQLLSVKHNERKLRGISNLPGKNGNILHLYDDGSLFSQEVSVSPYSNNYRVEISHNDKIIFTEPFIPRDLNDFSPVKPFYPINSLKIRQLVETNTPLKKEPSPISNLPVSSDSTEQITSKNQTAALLAQLWDSNEPTLPTNSLQTTSLETERPGPVSTVKSAIIRPAITTSLLAKPTSSFGKPNFKRKPGF